MKPIVAIFLLVALMAISMAGDALADGGGLLIPNIPPTFMSVEVDLQKEAHFLRVTVFDTNGAWGQTGDIYKISVRIYDIDQRILAAYRFQQYDAINGTASINRFSEIEGTSGILLLPECTVSHPFIPGAQYSGDQQLAGSQLNVTFSSLPVNGYRIEIMVEDREGAFSTIDTPYFKEAKAFSKESATAAALASLVIAGVVSTAVQVVQQRRVKS
jgi:hypothetical protein